MHYFAMHTPTAIVELVISAVVASCLLMAPTWVTIALAAKDRAIAACRRQAQLAQIAASNERLTGNIARIDRIIGGLSPDAQHLVADSWTSVRAAMVQILDRVATPAEASLTDDAIDVGWASLLRLPVIDWHVRHVQGIDDGLTDARMEALERLREDMRAASADIDVLGEKLAVVKSKAIWLAQDPHCPKFVAAYGRIVAEYGQILQPYLDDTVYFPSAQQATTRQPSSRFGFSLLQLPLMLRGRLSEQATATTIASRAWFPGIGIAGARPWIASGGGGLAAVERVKTYRITIVVAALLWGLVMLASQVVAAITFPEWGIIGASTFVVTAVVVSTVAALVAHRRSIRQGFADTSHRGVVNRELHGRIRDVALAEITRISLVLIDADLIARSLGGGDEHNPLVCRWRTLRAIYERDTEGFVELVDEGGDWEPRTMAAYQAASDIARAESNLKELFRFVHGDRAVRQRHLQVCAAYLAAIAPAGYADPATNPGLRSDDDDDDAAMLIALPPGTPVAGAPYPAATPHPHRNCAPEHTPTLACATALLKELELLDMHPDAHDFLPRFRRLITILAAHHPELGNTDPYAITSTQWQPEDLLAHEATMLH
ncbi:hypothetical protein ACFPVT_08280 [Corynebacterium choanae]|uniref:Uncharacterized protein n=1 Tax=Corynebacterium choanae TaxID=1862358 RepID=A0A3G6J887_9CORY|nr:hypothetical protein [Corynebacterium choanae]AZA14119.1 hypothetical protein CCHOA_08650 [Corynebacterium choanae]